MSPCSSRTQTPSLRSMAGKRITATLSPRHSGAPQRGRLPAFGEPGIHNHGYSTSAPAFGYGESWGYGFRARGLRPRPGMTKLRDPSRSPLQEVGDQLEAQPLA